MIINQHEMKYLLQTRLFSNLQEHSMETVAESSTLWAILSVKSPLQDHERRILTES